MTSSLSRAACGYYAYFHNKRVMWIFLLLLLGITIKGYQYYRQKSSMYSGWLMIAGDSNSRKIFELLMARLKNDTSIAKIIESSLGTGQNHFVKKYRAWFDNDIIIVFKNNSKVRVSLRFMHGASDEIKRLDNRWDDIRHCGIDCEQDCNFRRLSAEWKTFCSKKTWERRIICNDYTRKSLCGKVTPSSQKDVFSSEQIPSLLLYSHGLWGASDVLKRPKDFNTCLKKLGFISYYLQSLQSRVSVVWLSVPYISYHEIIENAYLEWDVQCQKRLSQEKQIEMFDLFSYVLEDKKRRVLAGDYHVTNLTKQHLLHLMWEKLWARTQMN